MRDPLSKVTKEIKPSGIRKFFDIVSEMKDAISLGVGEPDFDTPWHIREEGIYSLEKGRTFYTSNSGLKELKMEVCNYLKRKLDVDYDYNGEVMITVGGSEAIDIAMRAMLDPGDEVLIPQPSYVSYVPCVELTHAVPVIIELKEENEFRLTKEEVLEKITDKTKILVLPFPNNPTGSIMERKDLEDIAQVCIEKDIFVLSDEIYSELSYKEDHVSIACIPGMKERTVLINGFSKAYAMTGWRIGYTGSSKEIAKMMGSVQSHQTSNPNSIAQKAAVEALTGPQDSVVKMHAEFDKRRKYMYERICKMPLVSTIEPMGAFYVFVDASEVLGKKYKDTVVESVAQMAEILINDYNTAVVPCADFGFEKHLRLSYAISIEQIEKGLDRIESFLNDLK